MTASRPVSDLMTLAAVADYLGFADRSGALKWLRRHDVRVYRTDRRLRVRKAAIDAVLERHAEGDTVARARAMQKASGF